MPHEIPQCDTTPAHSIITKTPGPGPGCPSPSAPPRLLPLRAVVPAHTRGMNDTTRGMTNRANLQSTVTHRPAERPTILSLSLSRPLRSVRLSAPRSLPSPPFRLPPHASCPHPFSLSLSSSRRRVAPILSFSFTDVTAIHPSTQFRGILAVSFRPTAPENVKWMF